MFKIKKKEDKLCPTKKIEEIKEHSKISINEDNELLKDK
jgi:hypothetical protein